MGSDLEGHPKRLDTSVETAGKSACATVDTRSKILTLSELIQLDRKPMAAAVGLFDVLRAAHVRELRKIRERSGAVKLLVIVLADGGTLLPLKARVELVAALRVVDYVIGCGYKEMAALLSEFDPKRIDFLTDLDAHLSHELRARALSSRS